MTVTVMREGLTRSMPFELRDTGATGDGLTLDGYAAVFSERTLIDSWEGQFYESIRKGAFRKSMRERTPVMQFDHGRHPLVGSIPIGRIEELAEDDHGLMVRGRISDNWLMEPVRDAIRDGAVDGMSFRFSVVREEWRDNAGKLVRADELDALLWQPGERGPLERTLTEVKLHELGPVVFPAYDGTSVGVRARSLAETIADDDELRREVRRSLVRQATAPGDLQDPELRREVASALLFGSRADESMTSDAPPAGHPSDPQDRSKDAPAADGHPSGTTDAPPSDGHPSPNPTQRTLRLQAQIREITGLMDDVLAPIEDKDN
jgi:HK97 family phage prohead protease